MSIDHYLAAQKSGMHEVRARRAAGEDPYLPVLADLFPEYTRASQVPLGIVQIPLDRVAGTVTSARTTAFSRSFLPILEPTTEFAAKWEMLYDGIVEEGMRQPVTALEYYNEYYVVEGNKRVSISRLLETPFIEADVTRVLPLPEDSVRYRVYQEFLSFFEDTRTSYLIFTQEGGYDRLRAFAGRKAGERWPSEALIDLQSLYYRFEQAYEAQRSRDLALPTADALLIYLGIFDYRESVGKTPAIIAQELPRILPEFRVAASGKPAVVLEQAAEDKPNLLQQMFRPSPSKVRCAFLYAASPERSGWTYWHELARESLPSAFDGQVETIARTDVSPEECAAVIEQCLQEGYNLIFACSPVLLEGCIRASALHPSANILNSSLLASYHNVRSYYLRIFEAKFVLGMIAGAMADNNLIGYIADYPIYGTPVSINAFALGAQLVNPRAQISLDWSTLPGHDPEAALKRQGVSIISNRDISAPILESRAFGLYEDVGGQIRNLAMPIWNWSKLYENIIRSVMTGGFAGEGASNPDRAMSYYMGMSSGAIDLVCSERLPEGVRRLADLLHHELREGRLNPFQGPIFDQQGVCRVPQGQTLALEDLLGMDYLALNVIGSIPKTESLSPAAQQLVTLQGLRERRPSTLPTEHADEDLAAGR